MIYIIKNRHSPNQCQQLLDNDDTKLWWQNLTHSYCFCSNVQNFLIRLPSKTQNNSSPRILTLTISEPDFWNLKISLKFSRPFTLRLLITSFGPPKFLLWSIHFFLEPFRDDLELSETLLPTWMLEFNYLLNPFLFWYLFSIYKNYLHDSPLGNLLIV